MRGGQSGRYGESDKRCAGAMGRSSARCALHCIPQAHVVSAVSVEYNTDYRRRPKDPTSQTSAHYPGLQLLVSVLVGLLRHAPPSMLPRGRAI